jgi:hypothetical protein
MRKHNRRAARSVATSPFRLVASIVVGIASLGPLAVAALVSLLRSIAVEVERVQAQHAAKPEPTRTSTHVTINGPVVIGSTVNAPVAHTMIADVSRVRACACDHAPAFRAGAPSIMAG